MSPFIPWKPSCSANFLNKITTYSTVSSKWHSIEALSIRGNASPLETSAIDIISLCVIRRMGDFAFSLPETLFETFSLVKHASDIVHILQLQAMKKLFRIKTGDQNCG
mmetsp:Transcript_23501/g.34270  ORF Transcript_23501/g.34270 Transcript_23501/m.34270 type:complete len:108 (-) Transcript_23501:67-390(-)